MERYQFITFNFLELSGKNRKQNKTDTSTKVSETLHINNWM